MKKFTEEQNERYTVYPRKNLAFDIEDTAALLALVHKRFGNDWKSTHIAWCRLLQSQFEFRDFAKMVEELLGPDAGCVGFSED